ncbi:MFS transporter [Lichenicoccus roseus]|uniref:MFS transporter n=1 Tax=Lichenicoccus roseus TaxID=2683649 RepID=A0A5R9J4L3_9PROT|nr:MFS transporter [Lichenicoccus roseus]TLU72554.1 MFS transporter [Lichenicoccus roseus]
MTRIADAALRRHPAGAEQRATRLVFFVTGFASAAWAALVPFAKARAGLTDGTLGLLLLCLGIGSIVTMPLSGAATARFGCRRVIVATGIAALLALPLLATISSLWVLVPALMLFGAGIGGLDVAMNIQAIIVERASGRSMMSGFHGLFSLGGMAGAGGMALLLTVGLAPLQATLAVSLVMAAALALSASSLLPYGARSDGPAFALPHGIVLFIGLLCFVLFLAEGAVLDWSAVFLTAIDHIARARAGLGYAAFAATMTIGRLSGDRIVDALGPRRVVLVGGLCAASGFLLAVLASSWPVGLLGFALIGVGCANIVPVLFSAVGRQTVMPEPVAVPAITTLGYAGILVGPAGIGLVAHVGSLPVAFLVLALMLVAVSLCGRLL